MHCQGEKKTNANYVLGKYNSLHPQVTYSDKHHSNNLRFWEINLVLYKTTPFKTDPIFSQNPIVPSDNPLDDTTISFNEFLKRFVFGDQKNAKEIGAVNWDQRFLGINRCCLPCLYPYTYEKHKNFEFIVI